MGLIINAPRPRIVYVSGPYRHFLPDGSPDQARMLAEVKYESQWCRLVAECGHMWIAPLHNSVMLDELLTAKQFIERDLIVIGRLAPREDCMLMRPRWQESEGANLELEAAQKQELIVIYSAVGMPAIRQYLIELGGAGDADDIAAADAAMKEMELEGD